MASAPSAAAPASFGPELVSAVRRDFLRGLLFVLLPAAVANVLSLALPLYGMNLFNAVLTTRNLDTLLWLSVALALAILLYGAIDYLRAKLHGALADRASSRLGLPALLAAARSAGTAKSARPGQALADLDQVRGFLAGNAAAVPLDLVWSPLLLAALFTLHWGYGAFAALCALLLVGLGMAAEALTRRPLDEANQETAQAFGEVAVALRNAEAVEGLGMLPDLAQRWSRSQDGMLAKLWLGTRRVRALAAATKAFRLLMTGGMVCLGLVLTVRGEATAGSMVAANMILAKLLLPFELLVSSWRAWVGVGAAWRRLSDLLAAGRDPRGTLPLPCRSGRVVVDRLVFIPPASERPVLRGVSFAIEPGEVLGVVGPSGAGKSSLARLLVGAAPPTAGGVWLDGNSTWHWERGDFGRHVGFMPQATMLLQGTIAENIARLRDVDMAEVLAAARAVDLHDTIMMLPHGYATAIADAGFVLSGGQRQRLALARALFGRPKLLVLDEPNANLDAAGERVLLEALERVRGEGTSVVLVSHRPSLIAVADKLLVLREGMIDRFGTREAVMRALQAPPIQLVRRDPALPAVAPA